MSLTFAELNNIVDFNIHEWAKTIDSRVIIIKNTSIPEKVGELTYINLDVKFGDNGMYECTGNISYQRRGANPTEKELIELIEESIATANKCLLYLVVKERVE